MAPSSVIVFGVVVWTIAVSGAKQLRFRLKTDLCGRGLCISETEEDKSSSIKLPKSPNLQNLDLDVCELKLVNDEMQLKSLINIAKKPRRKIFIFKMHGL